MSVLGAILARVFGKDRAVRESPAATDGLAAQPNTSPSDWFISEEEREQERIVERVCDRLEAEVVRVDAKGQRLVWKPKRRALTLGASIRRLAKQLPECDPEEIEYAVLYWLEEVAGPENVTEQQMERYDARIERWLEAYHEHADGG